MAKYNTVFVQDVAIWIEAESIDAAAVIAKKWVKDQGGKFLLRSIYVEGWVEPIDDPEKPKPFNKPPSGTPGTPTVPTYEQMEQYLKASNE